MREHAEHRLCFGLTPASDHIRRVEIRLSDINGPRGGADILLQGGVVAFPTETVYGLGADAANPRALRRVFEIKGRPTDHPLIVHFGNAFLLDYWAGGIPDGAWRLASRFWPGPLTLILPRRAHVSRLVTGGAGHGGADRDLLTVLDVDGNALPFDEAVNRLPPGS